MVFILGYGALYIIVLIYTEGKRSSQLLTDAS